MLVKNLSFGSITINGETYGKDVIIDNGSIKQSCQRIVKTMWEYRTEWRDPGSGEPAANCPGTGGSAR